MTKVLIDSEVLEQVLEALIYCEAPDSSSEEQRFQAAIALRAALEQPLRYLDGGSRYKVTHMKTSGYCIIGLSGELLGRWVALVDATDNKHMDSYQQPPTVKHSLTVEQPQVELKPVSGVVIDGSMGVPALVKLGSEDAHIQKFGGQRLHTRPQPKREPIPSVMMDLGWELHGSNDAYQTWCMAVEWTELCHGIGGKK